MTLEQFGKELQAARQEKNISLMDISIETRISMKFLEAIEQGQFYLLPQTYIRAFLREYASFVGMDSEDMMKRYAQASGETTVAQSVPPLQPQSGTKSFSGNSIVFTPWQRQAMIAILAIIAFSIILVLAHISKKNEPTVRGSEVPFDKVVRETEAASAPQPPPPTQVPVDSSLPVASGKEDSLHLEIATADSVWINIVIDNGASEDHLYGPNKHHTWTAKEQFIVTMGNAGGATFTLNGKDIGALGKRGAVVRHAVITEALLHH